MNKSNISFPTADIWRAGPAYPVHYVAAPAVAAEVVVAAGVDNLDWVVCPQNLESAEKTQDYYHTGEWALADHMGSAVAKVQPRSRKLAVEEPDRQVAAATHFEVRQIDPVADLVAVAAGVAEVDGGLMGSGESVTLHPRAFVAQVLTQGLQEK